MLTIVLFFLFLISVNPFNFGETTVKLDSISGATAMLIIYTQNNGTTTGSDLKLSDLKLECANGKSYPLECLSDKKETLSSTGTKITCRASSSIPTTVKCGLIDYLLSITCSGDSFQIDEGKTPTLPKFGNVHLSLLSVEGKKVIIKITPQYTGSTITEDLTITGLIVNSKALICKADKILKLEQNTGTNLECSTSVEINANIACQLSGTVKITSGDDGYGDITLNKTSVKSSFGLVKIGLLSAKGTEITILISAEFSGSITANIAGLQLNNTRDLNCPSTNINVEKNGTQLKCSVNLGVEENDFVILTENNLRSSSFNKIQIDKEKNTCVAKNSKFGKVSIALKEVSGTLVRIMLTPTFSGITESNKFTITGLKLLFDKYKYDMTCKVNTKLNLNNNGTKFDCSVSYKIGGGKECTIEGVPAFTSEGDSFSDIIVLPGSVYSSYGNINLNLISVIGKDVRIKLTADYPGTTISSVNSIDNLKLNDRDMTCIIGTNIIFSDKPIYTCNLSDDVDGNMNWNLNGNNPSFNMPSGSKDIFEDFIISSTKVLSSYGQLKINLTKVEGKYAYISLKSEYRGTYSGTLSITGLYVDSKSLTCTSKGKDLILNDGVNSDANIECYFSDSDYSQETNTTCTLTGTPKASISLFTSIVITSYDKVISSVRNFGETIIYLYSIKGTTVYIQIKPNLKGKVRPIIQNLKLKVGEETLEVKCDVANKIQLTTVNRGTKIKCYILKTIPGGTSCNLIKEGNNVTIISDHGDIFGNVIISTETVDIKPTTSTYGDTQIKIVSIIGTQVIVNMIVSSTTIINSANPIIYGLSIGSNELNCISSQTVKFTNNTGQMVCSSSSKISCTSCELTGTPSIITPGDSEITFGQASIITSSPMKPLESSLGAINLRLKKVEGTYVYLTLFSTNNAKNYQKVDISNIYIDNQELNCSDSILFTSSGSEFICTVKEAITYNKDVKLSGSPNINIQSGEESIDVVNIDETFSQIKSGANSGLIINLISVKENIAIISLLASDISLRTLFRNFTIIGLAINNIPLEIFLDEIYLSNKATSIRVNLSESIEREVPCSLQGINSVQVTALEKTFGPISSSSMNEIISTSFKFGYGNISLLYIQGYSVILKIQTSKNDYTKNTELNGLYINNIPLICKFMNDIEFNSYGTDVECVPETAIEPEISCILTYRGDGDENFENITIIKNKLTSSYKYFGDVVIGLLSITGNNVKILVKTEYDNITTTNNIQIKNLYINGKDIICEYKDYIEFSTTGKELDCKLNSINNNDTYTLSATNAKIISFGDKFEFISIDENNKTVRTSPKIINDLIISLSSVGKERASIKLTTHEELYTYITISDLKIKVEEKNIYYYNTYTLTCPKKYTNFLLKNEFTDIMLCNISSSVPEGFSFSLLDEGVNVISFDKFEEVRIETNEIISSYFGDMNIQYISSAFAVMITTTSPGEIKSDFVISGIKINNEITLDCEINAKKDIKETGTMFYCTPKESIKLMGNPYITENGKNFSNIILEKNFIEQNSTNCYIYNNKASCEANYQCSYENEKYSFCDYNYYYIFNPNETETEMNSNCLLYLTEESCIKNKKCFWNTENKFTCKTRQIPHCLQLNRFEPFYCEECENDYRLNPAQTKCILDDDSIIYPCREYETYDSCTKKEYCTFYYYEYYHSYCSPINDERAENNCNLYLKAKECNSQENCEWINSYELGCVEKEINNCVKLNESDPTSCEKCEERFYLSGKNCEPFTSGEICGNYSNNVDKCNDINYCEYSTRAFCDGNKYCYRYLTESLCIEREACFWNKNSTNICKVKSISNCLILSESNGTFCSSCKEGYYSPWNDYTSCLKSEDVYSSDYNYDIPSFCHEYGGEEDNCLRDERCEFSEEPYCESYDNYEYNVNCFYYLTENLCLNISGCYWNTEKYEQCRFKNITNCEKLNSTNITECEICEKGYNFNGTDCIPNSNSAGNINNSIINLIIFMWVIIILL